MFHLVARSVSGTRLFRRETEALALWEYVTDAFPEVVALCLMPDHMHIILPHDDPGNRLHHPLSAFARWRNAFRRQRGPVWAERPPSQPIPDAAHLRRTVRYVHLNPCRRRLVRDPLSWPFSTHRDMVGFAARPVVAVAADPGGFHRFVSADDTVAASGTRLPAVSFESMTLHQVIAGVSAVWRVRTETVAERHPARRAFVRTAWHVGLRDVTALRRVTGLSRAQIYALVAGVPARGAVLADAIVDACARAAGDSRFTALAETDAR